LQVVVLDNHSEDDTAAVVADLMQGDHRVRHVRHEANIGMIPNFNFVRSQVTGAYFVVLMDDDDYEPWFLETALRGFAAATTARFVACNAITMRNGEYVKSQFDYWRGGFYPARSAVRKCLLGHYPIITNCLFSAELRDDFHFHAELGNVSDGFLMTCLFAKYDAYVDKTITGHWHNDGSNASSLQRFDPVLMVNTAVREYDLYQTFARSNRFIVAGMMMLWFKRFFSVLVAAHRSSLHEVLSKSILRERSGRFFLGLVHVCHALGAAAVFMWLLRAFRRVQTAIVARARPRAR
jgi:glycosyltransferase involved in cell wall biosynthesis